LELFDPATPIQPLIDPVFESAGIQVSIKREDLNHPRISGNKWWKLKYNLEAAIAQKHHTLLTFGGAYSNHIYATAATAKASGLRSIGIIRGEEVSPLNKTLTFAIGAGMKLHFISREAYRHKTESSFISELEERFGPFYLIPEGGSNELGVAGVASFAEQLPAHFDYVCSPVGTGATLAGLIRGRKGTGLLIGFPVLKGGDAWITEVNTFLPEFTNWQLFGEYHFGGYAKSTPELDLFIQKFESRHGAPIEHVYSGKMFYGIYDLAAKGYFKRGSTVLAIHTGGLRPNT
jgi:1-aminocyclopropane-1-carboxylate deaminase